MKLHSLFVKLFLWFWVATTLLGLSLILMETSRSEQQSRRWHRMTADAFAVYADSATDAHLDDEQPESKAYLSDLEKRTGIRAWLFNEENQEISGYAAPARAAHSTEKTQRIRVLITRARESKTTQFDPHGDVTLAAHMPPPVAGKNYVLVGELPVARFGPWEADASVHVMRLLAVLLVTGIVCWSLGRHLTQPIVVLREATRRMAKGDMSARTGEKLGRRRDELADLLHDFDAMAERIESLLADQQRMVEAQRRLLGDVSHELRSPLARLGVALELARDCIPALSPTSSHPEKPANLPSTQDLASTQVSTINLVNALDYIEHESARLSEIIDRLLTLARLESGVQEMERTPVDLTALLHAVVADADFEARATRRSVIITDYDECTTQGAPDLLRSAIENVLRNAVRYTLEETAVQVSLRAKISPQPHSLTTQDMFASIIVRDHGPGVPEEQLEDVFRPFYRVAGARDRKSGGDGLGLAITARAVQLHGGEVWAANAPDGGLVITFRLPIDVPGQQQRQAVIMALNPES